MKITAIFLKVFLFLILLTSGFTAWSNTYEVNNNGDYSPLPSDGESPIVGTFRWAVEQADMNSGPDTIVFNLSYPATITLTSGFPIFLTNDLVIIGPGKENLTISGNDITRHFWAQNGNIEISGLTLSNGRAKGGNGSGGGMGAGGSIFMHEGSKNGGGDLRLTIMAVEFENNQAIGGTGTGYGLGGGGLGGNGGTPNIYGPGGGGVFGNGGNPFIGMPQNGGGGGSFENGQNADMNMSGLGGEGNELFGKGGDGATEDFNPQTPFTIPGNGEFGGGGGGKPTPSGPSGGLGGFGGGGGNSLVGGAGGFGGGGGGGNSGGWGGAGGFGGGSGVGTWGSQRTFSGFGGGVDEETDRYEGGAGGMGAGGAIFITSGNLTLKKVHFSMNSTIGGTGITVPSTGQGHGGALFVFDHDRFSDVVTNQITPWGFTNPSSVTTCNVTYESNTASTPTESDNDVFGPVTVNPLSCFEITGRDTSICPGAMVNLENLIEGCYTELSYGISFGNYPNANGEVSPTKNTTYYIVDSLDGQLVDTAQITVTVNDQPDITGRDTTVCMDAMINLESLINGSPVNTLEFGSSFGTYGGPSTIQAIADATFYVRDSSAETGCVDTARINVEVLTTIECLMEFSFGDPCNCDQVVREDGMYYFKDTLVIDATPGQDIRFSTATATDFYNMPGFAMADGVPIVETEPGIYKLEFYKLSNAQAGGSVTLNGGEPVPIPEEDLELCYVNVDCPALIPTMGQWGLIILSLLLLIVGIGSVRQYHRSTSKIIGR